MTQQLRILGLDIGERTIGIASSTAGGASPSTHPTLRRASLKADLDSLTRLSAELQPEVVLVGYPLTPQGEVGDSARRAGKVARKLAGRLGVPVLGVDERYSTREAEEILRSPQRRKKRGGPDNHALAAVLILQRWHREGDAVVLARWPLPEGEEDGEEAGTED
ncbi:MAG: Holliday junction resolvase RuvX [Acidobacteria bacterium]|nr:Holliday junction resolvase RuvX [Acidobacteriota bacterium]